ncbi:hypothetical protein ES702_01817 [subsurface metagenome]
MIASCEQKVLKNFKGTREVTAREISFRSGISRSKIYKVLRSMEIRGTVSYRFDEANSGRIVKHYQLKKEV